MSATKHKWINDISRHKCQVSLKSYQNSNSLHDSDTIHNIGLNSLNPHIVLVWPHFNTFIILFETYREVQKILWRPVVVIVDCVDITLEHSWPSWSGQNTLWRLSWHYIIIRPGSGSSQLMAVHQSRLQTVQWPSGVTAAHMPVPSGPTTPPLLSLM